MPKEIKRIKLTIENPGGVDRKAWPITQGVPFADVDLERGSPVRAVGPDGQALPTQAACLATWNRDMKYVKWLLVDFQADLMADKTPEYFLEYGPGVEAVEPEQGVSTERSGERLRVDTGRLRLDFRLPHSGGQPHFAFIPPPQPAVASIEGARDFLSGCWIRKGDGWHDVFRGNPGPHLYLIDTYGEVYDSLGAGPTPKVIVEESGPMRVCVSVKGYHASENGLHLCPYTVRIHAYAGRNDLRIFHTFVFDQDPNALAFSEVGLFFPLDLGDDLRMGFGGQDKAHWAERWEEGRFLQNSDISYRVTRDGEPFGEGERTRGWASLCGREASALFVIRDHWQEYPKGFTVDSRGLSLQIWPAACGEKLVFSTPWKETAVRFDATRDEETVKRILQENPTAPLHLKSFNCQSEEDAAWIEEMVRKYAPDRPASHNDTDTSDGTGGAKTTEFWLRLSTEPIDDESAEAFAICVQEPIIAPPDPQYTYRTEATRGHYYAGDERFAEVDAALDQIVETLVVEPRERCRLYGMMRYGNLVCSHSPGAGAAYRLHYRTNSIEGLKHVGPYNNEANDQVWALWGNFVRTAKRRHFLLASAYSQTMADVTVCHAHPSHPEYVGLIHYHSAHQWSGGHSPSHTLTLGIMLHYYFTGNRRLLEVALEAADWAVRNQEPAGIITERRGGGKREFTGPLACVIEAYLVTWAEKYGGLARRSLNWLLKTQSVPGLIPSSAQTLGDLGEEAFVQPSSKPAQHGGIMFSIYYEGVRHFNSDLLKKTILAEADHMVWEYPVSGFFTLDMARKWLTPRSKLWSVGNGWHWTSWGGPPGGNSVPGGVGMAYDLTKDPIYAAWAKYHVLSFFTDMARRVETLSHVTFTNVTFGGYIPLMMSTVARAMDHDPEGFAKAEAEWRRKRAEMGHDVYDGPFPGIPPNWDNFDPNANVKSIDPVEIELRTPPPAPPPKSIGVPEGYDA